MGGFAGIVDFRAPPDRSLVQRMGDALAHRGPDASGEWSDGPVAFTHQLRKVLPTRSAQPLVTDDLVVMLDGWIYDHHQVALEAGDEAALTDTQALASAFRHWGVRLTEHIDGDFAAAIWDRNAERLTLIRDRLGARPLYWSKLAGRLAFASELPALLKVGWVGREVARDRVAEFLSFAVVHAPRTLLRDVQQIEAAHWMHADVGGVEIRRYWSLNYAPRGVRQPPDHEVVDSLRQAVQRAVRRRVPPGVETGLFLSGGLGSAAIAAAARDRLLDLPSFTVSFADDPYPELPFAGRVAHLLGLEHTEVVVDTPQLAAEFDDTVAALGHPVGNPAAILQMVLCRVTRRDVRVALSGMGGEELFGGRMLDRLGRALRVAGALSKVPGPGRELLRRVLGRRGQKLTVPPERYVLELGIGGTDLFSLEERQRLLRNPDLARPRVRQQVLSPFYEGLDTDPINTALHGYLRSWLGESSLVRADRTAAAAGLDVRFPLLDREVVERAASLPGAFKLRRVGGALHTRWALRSMVSGILPSTLVHRPKRSLPAPLGGWLRGPGRLFFEERYASLLEDPHELFRAAALEDLRAAVFIDPRAGFRLWTLFILDAWLRMLPRW